MTTERVDAPDGAMGNDKHENEPRPFDADFVAATQGVRSGIEDFFAYEYELLDTRRYRQWMGLLTDDIEYVIPLRRSVRFGEWDREYTHESDLGAMWITDDWMTIDQRVRQLDTGIHWAEEPAARMSRAISNIRIDSIVAGSTTAPERLITTSRFTIYRNRLETETDVLAGRRIDTLTRDGSSWLISHREVQLAQNVLLAKNLTFFI